MAFRPSYRRTIGPEEVELNMTPVMNLMVCIIPLLLTSVQFIKIGVIDLNLPPAVGVGTTSSLLEAPKETKKNLDLAVTITDKGFFISSSLAVLKSLDGEGPSIPKTEQGDYNFTTLSQQLLEIKKRALNNFPDTEKIIIEAEPEINYQLLITTMDAARSITVGDKMYTLFPNVSLAAGVI